MLFKFIHLLIDKVPIRSHFVPTFCKAFSIISFSPTLNILTINLLFFIPSPLLSQTTHLKCSLFLPNFFVLNITTFLNITKGLLLSVQKGPIDSNSDTNLSLTALQSIIRSAYLLFCSRYNCRLSFI